MLWSMTFGSKAAEQPLLVSCFKKLSVASGITILCYEVTGIASEYHIIDFSLRTRTQTNHFADANKMVKYQLSCIVTGIFGIHQECDVDMVCKTYTYSTSLRIASPI